MLNFASILIGQFHFNRKLKFHEISCFLHKKCKKWQFCNMFFTCLHKVTCKIGNLQTGLGSKYPLDRSKSACHREFWPLKNWPPSCYHVFGKNDDFRTRKTRISGYVTQFLTLFFHVYGSLKSFERSKTVKLTCHLAIWGRGVYIHIFQRDRWNFEFYPQNRYFAIWSKNIVEFYI